MVGVGVENLFTLEVFSVDLEADYGLAISVLHICLDNLFADVAIGLEVFFAVMRYVAVVYPHRAPLIFTKRLLWFVTAGLFVLLVPKNIFFSFGNSTLWLFHDGIWGNVSNYVNFLVKTGLPIPIMFICALRISVTLSQSFRFRRSQHHMQSSSTSHFLTFILFVMNFSMFLTYVPFFIYNFIPQLFVLSDPYGYAKFHLVDQFSDILYHIHHAIFSVFLLLGSTYRSKLFSWCRPGSLNSPNIIVLSLVEFRE